MIMQKRRVALLYDQDLLGDSLEHILSKLSDVEIVGAWVFDSDIVERLSSCAPDVMLLAEEGPPTDRLDCLAAQVLEAFPQVPLIRVKLSQDTVHIYTSRTFPARSVDLIEAIRRLPISPQRTTALSSNQEET